MTKAEAIAMLKRIQEPEAWEPQINQAAFEALDMAIEALSQESSEDVISRQAAIDAVKKNTFRLTFAEEQNCEGHVAWSADAVYSDVMEGELLELPSAQPEWNNHTVACLLAELFDDTCACNYNGINEWLPGKCELLDSCPNPAGVACWEQFLTHRAERRTDGEIIPE